MDDTLSACEEALGYRFENRSLLKVALIHASDKGTTHLTDKDIEALPPEHVATDNERLEFLGDAVLGFVTCEHLYGNYPDYAEGQLTHVKSIVVSRRTLGRVAQRMDMQQFIIVGKGMDKSKKLPNSVLANLFEALVAAIYLDGGMDAARRFIIERLVNEVEIVESNAHVKNYKSLLQQYAQRELNLTPVYRTVSELGPDHAKEFVITAVVGTREFPPGRGFSKKAAQQHAAELALETLLEEQGDEVDFIDS